MRWLLLVVCLAGAVLAADGDQPPVQGMIRLPIKFPRLAITEGPPELPPDLADAKEPPEHVALPWVPGYIEQVALGKSVTCSAIAYGQAKLVTDGQKEAEEDAALELTSKLQWVRIDLGRAYEIWDIAVWHFHREFVVVRDVIVQVSDDPNFVDKVTTLFNNDKDNSAKLGTGTDPHYWDTHLGRIIDGKRTKARYVRLYSRGSSYTDALNRYTEVEVWAVDPAGSDWVPLPIVYPRATHLEGPGAADAYRVAAEAVGGEVEPPPTTTPPPPPAPPKCRQLARGRPVTTSGKVLSGRLAQVTDGQKDAGPDTAVEVSPRSQWVQIDLGGDHTLHYIGLWHNFLDPSTIVRGVLVQVSRDPKFQTGVTTLYNGDRLNSQGHGRGQDAYYYESNLGRLIHAGGVKARYVRCWSVGSTCTDALNRWIEVEVWGL